MKTIASAFAGIVSHATAALMAVFFVAGCTGPATAPAGEATAPNPAAAQACLPSGEMYAHLQQRYGEEAVWMGKSEGGMTVLFLSPERTWSVVVFGDGAGCVALAGQGFRVREGAT